MSPNLHQKYWVSPRPAIVQDELAHIGASLRFSQTPTNFLAQMRKDYGDTFLVDVFGYKLFCVFSAQGLKSLYAAAEDEARFDVLSQENAFVSPQQTLDTLTSGKAKEKQAVADIMALVGAIMQRREDSNLWPDDSFTFLCRRFKSEERQVTLSKLTHNIINANQGFLSNLYAALSWTLINLKQHPLTQQRLEQEILVTKARFGDAFYESQEALDSMRFCEQLLMESIRLAQRSITLRKVMKEIQFDCGSEVYTIQPGVYITTMLSVGNTQTPELARFDPDHYQGRKIDPQLVPEGKETISTFGHGKHACPAQKFSHNMCKVLLSWLLLTFEFSSLDRVVEPSSTQMGGVSRAAEDVLLHYSRKHRV